MSTTTAQIKISALEKSPHNARKTYSAEGIKELKASILAYGLLHNFVVNKKGDKYHVIDGARRLEAIQQLIKEKKLGDMQVSCEVVSEPTALEMSIAANTVREQMHPADEFEAYAALISKKVKPEDIAIRFGVSEKQVLQRLKLGQVAPDIMKAFRAGKLKLEALMAFTLTDDQKKQMAVFKSLKEWERRDHSIREKIMKQSISSGDSIAGFVGLAAYKAAGGTITKNLFGDEVYLDDSTLVNKLATDKLNIEVEKLKKEGFGWVEASIKKDHEFVWACEETPCKTKEQKANCGCYVSIGYGGKIDIERGLMKKGKKKNIVSKGSVTSEAPKKKPKEGISEALRMDLQSYRLQIAQAKIANAGQIAYDICVFKAISGVLDTERHIYGGADISFRAHYPTDQVKKDKTLALESLSMSYKALNMDWIKIKNESDRFKSFRDLNPQEKAEILAFAVSQTIEPSLSDRADKDSFMETAYSMLVGSSASRYWRPTRENYLNRITSDQIVKIGKELFGNKWIPKSVNKSFLVTQFHDIFADPKKAAEGNMELQDRIQSWLPAGMAFAEDKDRVKKAA